MNQKNATETKNLPAKKEQNKMVHHDCDTRPECSDCNRTIEVDCPPLSVEYEGVYVGDTVALISESELAEKFEVRPGSLLLQLMKHNFPVYSVHDVPYVSIENVSFMFKTSNICIADMD